MPRALPILSLWVLAGSPVWPAAALAIRFEDGPFIELRINAVDSGVPSLSYEDTFTLSVLENRFPWQNAQTPLARIIHDNKWKRENHRVILCVYRGN